MKQYIQESKVVDAEQWFEVTHDRPGGQNTRPIYHLDVRHYRGIENRGEKVCSNCGRPFLDHGWIEESSVMVCPGDYVITHEAENKTTESKEFFENSYKQANSSSIAGGIHLSDLVSIHENLKEKCKSKECEEVENCNHCPVLSARRTLSEILGETP